MRRVLDGLYGLALWTAALCLVGIAALVLVQVLGRIVDRVALGLGIEPLGIAVPSLAEIGGFLFVGAAFLALAGTLRSGGHVRVTMLLRMAGPTGQRVLTLLVVAAATALAGFAAWNAGVQALDSWRFESVSYGMVRVPLWIPQAVMTLGLGVFCISLLDELTSAARGRTPAFRRSEQAREKQGIG